MTRAILSGWTDDTKVCLRPECGRVIRRKGSVHPNSLAWKNRQYCYSPSCASKVKAGEGHATPEAD